MNFNSILGLPLLLARLINGYIKSFFYIKAYKSQGKKLASKDVIRLDLGSGARRGCDDWVTVDLVGADINYDLKNGLPLPDRSVDVIYSSHLLEHIPYKALLIFLSECYRVLKNNGEFLVCVPNAALYIKAYTEGTNFGANHNLHLPAIVDTGSRIDQLNYTAYMDGEHHFMFDNENIVNILLRAGFADVRLRNYDPELDSIDRYYESLYAVAIK
jgi:predicted SAM-dependent methyltransferase